uniref:SFRICE_016013 n=1 Tax=Spodoptera frugiperda TaxID=7108 RepID=A0A2H1VMX5_SPOFR
MADKTNYRPISLVTIVAMVLDSVLNSHLTKHKQIHDLKFGFRPGLLTETAMISLKHTVKYYTDRRTPVGRVNSRMQGGLSSPSLFNLYENALVEELSSMRVGCYVDGVCCNNFSYADDMVLLAPSIGALRKLLAVCESFVALHTVCMVFKWGNKDPLIQVIFLNGVSLNRVRQFKYLGHWVTDDLKDDVDMERERRALSVQANMLARRFSRCTDAIKITFFKAYCTSLYTGSLWVNYTQRAYYALRIQFNNAFRALLRLPRFCSASAMFADAHIYGFTALWRKKTASFVSRLRGSHHSILSAIADRHDCPLIWKLVQRTTSLLTITQSKKVIKILKQPPEAECGCFDDIPFAQGQWWTTSRNPSSPKTGSLNDVICLCDTDGEYSKPSPNGEVICECKEDNNSTLKTSVDSGTSTMDKLVLSYQSSDPQIIAVNQDIMPEPPPQVSPQVLPQYWPLTPLQMRPQVPLQVPPQVPLQVPPQVPLQVPPQVPLQVPPQVAAALIHPNPVRRKSVVKLACDWIDYKSLMKMRSELSIETSGFKACKRIPKAPRDRLVELNFEEAVMYYTTKNPHLFRDLVQQSLQDPIDYDDKTKKQEVKKEPSRARKLFNKLKPKVKQEEPVPPPPIEVEELCECPYGRIPPPIAYITPTAALSPKQRQKLYPKGLKLHLGGKGSLSRGLADIWP